MESQPREQAGKLGPPHRRPTPWSHVVLRCMLHKRRLSSYAGSATQLFGLVQPCRIDAAGGGVGPMNALSAEFDYCLIWKDGLLMLKMGTFTSNQDKTADGGAPSHADESTGTQSRRRMPHICSECISSPVPALVQPHHPRQGSTCRKSRLGPSMLGPDSR